MAIGINDLDDDDVIEQEQEDILSALFASPPSEDEDDDFMLDFLKSKGIDDPENIMFEDDNGEVINRSWNDLTREEQINILNTPITPEQEVTDNSNSDITDEEIQLLNDIRSRGMTPQQYIDALQGQQANYEPTYKVDDLSDDELYILDLESRVGEISEDEAAQELSIAKQNEELYKKKVEGIRKEYKEREDFISEQEQAELMQQQQEAFNVYQQNVFNAIDNFNSVGSLDLNFDDEDKDKLAEFMLSQDLAGNNYLYRALQDPETLVKAAWFILNGDEAFDNIQDYFVNLIKLVSERQYKKGFEEGQKGVSSKPLIVINTKKQNQNRLITNVDDLDDDM